MASATQKSSESEALGAHREPVRGLGLRKAVGPN